MDLDIVLGFYAILCEYANIMPKSLNGPRHVNLSFYDMTYSITCECTKMQLCSFQMILY